MCMGYVTKTYKPTVKHGHTTENKGRRWKKMKKKEEERSKLVRWNAQPTVSRKITQGYLYESPEV